MYVILFHYQGPLNIVTSPGYQTIISYLYIKILSCDTVTRQDRSSISVNIVSLHTNTLIAHWGRLVLYIGILSVRA